ncbi:MAG: right-handed parallel beta-helix repeat-containing protein [Thermoplasmata archaeon]|nr:MAG: right-handed parallel beta-helix repeat-containing protein [Thermoplasmata archaeon]
MVFSLIVIIVETAPIVKAPTTWYVDDVLGNGGPGNPPEDFTSIQDAINVAQPGDTVFVYNGTYYENVVVSKQINLTGEDSETTIIDSKGIGDVVHILANWVNITGFQMMNSSNSGSGIYLQSSDYCKIEYCRCRLNEFDIYLDSLSNNNIIINNICNTFWGGINLDSSSDNKISNNRGYIQLSSSSNNTLSYNNGRIYLHLSNGNRIENNDLSLAFNGIELAFSSNNLIKNNICNNCHWEGIFLYNSSNNIIENNNCSYSDYGIFLGGPDFKSSDNNKILNNICSYNDLHGIHLFPASHNKIVNNTCSGNGRVGINLEKMFLTVTNYNIIENNILNSNGYDGIYLEDSSGNTINNNTCNSNNRNGVTIVATDTIPIYNTLHNNICLDNENGIYITASEECIIRHNYCASNKENGIALYGISNNLLTQNTLFKNYRGISSDSILDNTIEGNICNSNILFGMSLESSNNNCIYHNHFINNIIQAYDDGINRWNLSYPTGGNYWSNFNEPHEGAYDDFKGQDQNILGRDGIVDSGTITGGGKNPYIIDSNSQDNYPLIGPSPYFPIENYTLLKRGWNLISLPLIQNNQNLTKVLESIDGYYDAVQWYNITDTNDPWKHYKVGKPYGNDLSQINETMGFWIHITQPGDTIFLYNGTQPTVSQTITLHPGWNQVGYPSLRSYNRTEGLNNLTFDQEVDSILTYDAATQKWKVISSSDYFEIGRGYYIHAKTKCEWEVPL